MEGGLREIVKEYAGRVLLLWQENNDDAIIIDITGDQFTNQKCFSPKIIAQKANFVLNFLPYVLE